MFSESFEVRGNGRWVWSCKKATKGRGFLNPAKKRTECGALVWQTGALVRREEAHRSHTLPRGHGKWSGLPSLQDYKEVTKPMVLTTVLSLTSVFFIALHGQGMRESWVSSSMTPCLFILEFLTEWAACCFCLVDWPVISVPSAEFSDTYSHACLFTWCWRFKFRAPGLHSKGFYLLICLPKVIVCLTIGKNGHMTGRKHHPQCDTSLSTLKDFWIVRKADLSCCSFCLSSDKSLSNTLIFSWLIFSICKRHFA